MKDQILNAIKNNPGITLSELEQRAIKRNVSLDQLYAVLETIHKDKRIKRTVSKTDITYQFQEPKTSSTAYAELQEKLSDSYPWPGKNGVSEFVMPFPEWDLSFMFLSPEELDEYRGKIKRTWQSPKTRYRKTSSTT